MFDVSWQVQILSPRLGNAKKSFNFISASMTRIRFILSRILHQNAITLGYDAVIDISLCEKPFCFYVRFDKVSNKPTW